MRKATSSLAIVFLLVLTAPVVNAADEVDLRILTYPIGLVVGEQPIEADLGPDGAPAELFLDGQQVCALTASKPRCTVDLGEAPHVHLLELVRRDESGHVIAHASRWVNRPGQEAELAIQLAPRSAAGICGGKALWSHPLKKAPVLLEITQDGLILRIAEDGRSFRFPCPDPDEPHVLAASAIFSDGRRAEAVALSGGFGGHMEAGLTAVPLVAETEGHKACEAITAALGDKVKPASRTGFEVVFVLDPRAGYDTLRRSGWHGSAMPSTNIFTKQYEQMSQQGTKGSEPKPRNSWLKSEASLIDAEKMWFVVPDSELHRANGFSEGKPNWLRLLFHFGAKDVKEKLRLADAVATSGLVAAAGPRRRAVVVLLANRADRDGSGFSPQEAQTYLAEVGVPLFVLRNGKLRDDGWPAGASIKTMEAMADALEEIKIHLEEQCVAWFPGEMHPNQIAASLPEGVEIAGRQGDELEGVETVWRQAADTDVAMTAATEVAGEEPVGRTRVEVTAVTVLFAVRDDHGTPIIDLTPDEIEVTEDGVPVSVLDVGRMARIGSGEAETGAARGPITAGEGVDQPAATDVSMPVAVYVDRRLSGSLEISSALEALADRSDWLTSLGPVNVVVADQQVAAVLENSSDPDSVRNTLATLAEQPAGRHSIEQIRTRFLRDIRKVPNRLTPNDPNTPGSPNEDNPEPSSFDRLKAGEEVQEFERSQVLTAARGAIFEEDGILRQAVRRVSDWALESQTSRPRLLLLVGTGFDEDPVDFYLPFVERVETQNAGSAREEFKRFRQSARVDEAGQALAASGWLVVPVASRTVGAQSISADTAGGDRFQTFLSAQPDAIRTDYADFLLLDPLGSQRHLAAPSGGDVAVGGDGLDLLIDASSGWYHLTYQIDRPPDGANHRLQISSNRPGTSIRSTSVIASETLEGMAAARVRRLLGGSGETGVLEVEIALTEPQRADGKTMTAEATITMRLDAIAALLEEGGQRNLRVSVGVATRDSEPFVLHRIESVEGVVNAWGYRVPLRWPTGPATLSVVVEDLGTGAWGGAVTDLK
jgi:hypothetical protein